MTPAEIVAIFVEEAEKRGSVEQAIKDMKESAALMSEDVWEATGGCPCCKTYADHAKLCALVVRTLESKGRN